MRDGLRRNGTWNIEVAKSGKYEISLRRWPAEADAPIAAGLPEQGARAATAKGPHDFVIVEGHRDMWEISARTRLP